MYFAKALAVTSLLIIIPVSLVGWSSDTVLAPDTPRTESISQTYEKFVTHVGAENTECWYYVPSVLKNGVDAPVVVFLHGGMFSYPDVYLAHVEHLLSQGYIVIFPRYLKQDPLNVYRDLIRDADQKKYLDRAVAAVNQALSELESVADLDNITIYGHSTGGLLALAWPNQQWQPKNMLLANTNIDAKAAMPGFVTSMISLKPLPWRKSAGTINYPVVLLCGDEDAIGSCLGSALIYHALRKSPEKAIYQLHSDRHGSPPIVANHFAPLASKNAFVALFFKVMQTSMTPDAADLRFYWVALDNVLEERYFISFDMGRWSDAQPVNPVTTLDYMRRQH